MMVREVLEALEEARDGTILDGTLGGGGHAEAMLQHWPGCRILGVDRDPEALRAATARLSAHSTRVRFLQMTFDQAMDDAQVMRDGLHGALLDLGVSSRQLDAAERGFAFRRGAPLDMRMGEEGQETAADLLNEATEEELARIFRDFGEEPRWRKLAREVIRRRRNELFRTSDDLVGALAGALGRSPSMREKARVFQALRIAVNQELSILTRGLERIREGLREGGILAVISYHSLEDRIVKQAFREWSRDCICPPGIPVCTCRGKALGKPLFKGSRDPSDSEVARNPRSRSARLRAWRKAS